MKEKPMKPLLVAALIILTSGLSLAEPLTTPQANKKNQKDTAAIQAVLDMQRDAWNRGDIEDYMSGYAQSKDTVFISGDSLTRGWQTVLERYKKGYDTREKMGTLTFSEVEINLIGNDAAVVLGRWHLRRTNDEPHGRFTLLFRRMKSGWRIVHDHTSSAG